MVSFEQLNNIDYVLMGGLALLFLVQVYWYGRYMAAPARRLRKSKKSPITNRRRPRRLRHSLCA